MTSTDTAITEINALGVPYRITYADGYYYCVIYDESCPRDNGWRNTMAEAIVNAILEYKKLLLQE